MKRRLFTVSCALIAACSSKGSSTEVPQTSSPLPDGAAPTAVEVGLDAGIVAAEVGLDSGDDALDGGPRSPARAYVVGSGLQGPEGTNTYLSVLATLDPQEIDYTRARELAGWADVWVWQGKVFVADGESPVVTRYAVDDRLELVEEGKLNFAAYGLREAQFWNAIWVGPQKAYMKNGEGQYVVWNPATMEITGTMPHPALDTRPGLLLRGATSDRGAVVHGGRLYHPYYWANETWSKYAPDSRIAIYDVVTDQLVKVLEAPCTGLDVATADDAGNVYFSNWTGNVGLSHVLGAPAPCGVRVAAGSDEIDPTWTTPWAQITGGRHAAALRYAGDGQAFLSVFHHERTTFDATTDAFALVGSTNWRIWRFDLQTRQGVPIEGIDWNSGATYTQRIDGTNYVLVPSADYKSSQIYAVRGNAVEPRFKTRGWGLRLFEVR